MPKAGCGKAEPEEKLEAMGGMCRSCDGHVSPEYEYDYEDESEYEYEMQ